MLSSLSVTIRHLLLVRGLAATSCLHVRRDYALAQSSDAQLQEASAEIVLGLCESQIKLIIHLARSWLS